MPKPPSSLASLTAWPWWGRAGIGLGMAVGLNALAAVWIREPVERFWVLLPVLIGIAAYGLRLIPPPRWPQQSLILKSVMVVLLWTFPVLLYISLCRATQSPVSLWELLIIVYFFVFCLEIPLLYFLQGVKALEDWTRQKLEPRLGRVGGYASTLCVRVCMYALLIPVLLAVLGIHRPKLPSRPMTFVESQWVEPISFPSREARPLTLRGEFLKHPESLGTVIVCHGVGANRSDIEPIVKLIYDCRFDVLSFDFRGHGVSDGHTITYGLNERRDVQGAYDYLLSRPDVDETRLFVLGVSMGGSSALMALPEMPLVQAAVIDSAFADLGQMLDHQLRYYPTIMQSSMAEITKLVGWLETGHDLTAATPQQALAQISCPLTIIHSRDDALVPYTQAEQLVPAVSNLHAFHITEEGGHISSAFVDPWSYQELIRSTFQVERTTRQKSEE